MQRARLINAANGDKPSYTRSQSTPRKAKSPTQRMHTYHIVALHVSVATVDMNHAEEGAN